MFLTDMKPNSGSRGKKKDRVELGFVSHTCAIVRRRHPVYVAVVAGGGLGLGGKLRPHHGAAAQQLGMASQSDKTCRSYDKYP